ncbi:MAG: hypothetical protein Q9162_001723 [Coniocarpon cinnabarinum]
MSKPAERRTDWAEDDDDVETSTALPAKTITKNPDGTETHVSYRVREDGRRVKTTQIIRKSVHKQRVNPRIAERRHWSKFGLSAKDPAGPQSDTTSVGENIELNLKVGFKGGDAGEKGEVEKEMQDLQDKQKAALATARVKCRICSGEHFTARCPFKGTMAPEGEMNAPDATGATAAAVAGDEGAAGAGKSGKYLPPSMRAGASGGGERMMGKHERDDLATLRVTNVSEYAEEDELRDLFGRSGRVTRVFLAKDRETGRAKGFAFVSFADRNDAAKACAKMDGFGYNNLILRVEFAKKTT